MAGLQVKSSPQAPPAVADNVWLDAGPGWIAHNWFYLTAEAEVAVMKTIGRHASGSSSSSSSSSCSSSGGSSSSSQSVCTILLFAQNYLAKIAVLTNTRVSISRHRRRPLGCGRR
ncbi:hypothetical protein KM043_016237 [Ampulex compressa]|nr:hypothetical protein KM043_016237 [Ampulex compressa]